ncbi:MAG TPA: LicD family protein [Candidatus Cloacimonadota bacterium]|nr:LicD family protein [Candidatus Cloacimonadota bacterium]
MAGKTKLEGKNLTEALQILQAVTLELEKAGISYWLEGGTLLGVIRENRLLPWDNDMDISMCISERRKLIKVAFQLMLKGFRISTRFYNRKMPPFRKGELRMIKIRKFHKFLKKGEVMLDVFLKRKKNNEYFWTVGIKSPVLKSVPARFYDQLDWIDFNGKKYMIPADFDGYLSYRYGDWRTPVKEWNFKKDDKAIVAEKEQN